MTESLVEEWIIKNKEKGINAETLIKSLSFVSYPYSKYCSTVFAMEMDSWNVPLVHNLSEEISAGTQKGYEETREFAEYLGERMAISMNFFKGYTNKQISQQTEVLKELRQFKQNAKKELRRFKKYSASLEQEVKTLREALSECCCEYKNDGIPRCYARRDDVDGHCIGAKEGCFIYKTLKGGEK